MFLWQDHSNHDASRKLANHCPEWIQRSPKEHNLGYKNWESTVKNSIPVAIFCKSDSISVIISGTDTSNSTAASNKSLFTSEAILLVESLLLTSNGSLDKVVLAQCCTQTRVNCTRFNNKFAGNLLPRFPEDSDGEVNFTRLEVAGKQKTQHLPVNNLM